MIGAVDLAPNTYFSYASGTFPPSNTYLRYASYSLASYGVPYPFYAITYSLIEASCAYLVAQLETAYYLAESHY